MTFDTGTWAWSREPAEWKSQGAGELTWRCDAGSDFWRLTSSGVIKDDGNGYLRSLGDEDFAITGRFDADLSNEYDQLGVLVFESPESWLKAGVELTGDHLKFSVVHTSGTSDWSVADGTMPFELQVQRRSDTLEVAVGPSREELSLVRQLSMDGLLSVGPYSCAPVGPGFEASARSVELTTGPKPDR